MGWHGTSSWHLSPKYLQKSRFLLWLGICSAGPSVPGWESGGFLAGCSRLLLRVCGTIGSPSGGKFRPRCADIAGRDGAAGQQSWLPAGCPGIARLRSPGCLAVGMKGLMVPLPLPSAWDGGAQDQGSTTGTSFLQKALEDRAHGASHRMDGAQTASGPRPGPRSQDAAPCLRAELFQLPAPGKRLRRDLLALGLWRMPSIKLLFGGLAGSRQSWKGITRALAHHPSRTLIKRIGLCATSLSDSSTRVSLIPDVCKSPRARLRGVQECCPIPQGMRAHSWVPTQQGAANPANSKYQCKHGALGGGALGCIQP